MSSYRVSLDKELSVEVEAETVTFKDGVVVFYEDRNPKELSSSEDLVTAFKEWREVERID